MVFFIEPAVLKAGHHLVATIALSPFKPLLFKADANASSYLPQPYNSAVSNQLIPPL